MKLTDVLANRAAPADDRPDKEYLVIYQRTRDFAGAVYESRKVVTAKSAHLLFRALYEDEVDRVDNTVSVEIRLIREAT